MPEPHDPSISAERLPLPDSQRQSLVTGVRCLPPAPAPEEEQVVR